VSNRRALITLLGGAAAWPLAARAQQPDRMRRVGALFATSPDPNSALLPALRQYLGPDLMIEARWARNDPEQLLTLAEELVGLGPDVIVTSNTAATMAARRATANIPLVCAACTDPVGMDLATNEARPGTNVTGILTRVEGLTGKQLELASEVLPRMITVGVLINISNPSNLVQRREVESAAAKLRVIVVPAEVRAPGDLYPAFRGLERSGVNLVLVLQDSMFLVERKRIALIAAATRRPTMFSFRENVEDGGLLSYGIDLRENYRRAATYVGRILRGQKPSDLPFEFATKLAFTINLQTATLLGLTVPPTLLARADEVIE
jgi:putative ABC transport system substrate-binding protein